MVRFESGETRVVTAQDIDRAPVFSASKRHYDDCSPDEIQEAYRWHDALKPVLENSLERGEREAFVSAVADKLGVGRATVYGLTSRFVR